MMHVGERHLVISKSAPEGFKTPFEFTVMEIANNNPRYIRTNGSAGIWRDVQDYDFVQELPTSTVVTEEGNPEKIVHLNLEFGQIEIELVGDGNKRIILSSADGIDDIIETSDPTQVLIVDLTDSVRFK